MISEEIMKFTSRNFRNKITINGFDLRIFTYSRYNRNKFSGSNILVDDCSS